MGSGRPFGDHAKKCFFKKHFPAHENLSIGIVLEGVRWVHEREVARSQPDGRQKCQPLAPEVLSPRGGLLGGLLPCQGGTVRGRHLHARVRSPKGPDNAWRAGTEAGGQVLPRDRLAAAGHGLCGVSQAQA